MQKEDARASELRQHSRERRDMEFQDWLANLQHITAWSTARARAFRQLELWKMWTEDGYSWARDGLQQ